MVDAIVPVRHEIGPDEDPEDLEIEVAVRRHFRIIAEGAVPEPTVIRLLDRNGDPLPLYAFQAGGWSSTDTIRLEGGGTAIHSVSEDAVELVVVAPPWIDGGRERQRQPVTFVAGEVTELRVVLD